MPYNEHHPIDFYPRRLYQDELHDPYKVLDKFFRWDSLPGWRDHLLKWYEAAIRQHYPWQKHEYVELFQKWEFLEILIEAAWVIHQRGSSIRRKAEHGPTDTEQELLICSEALHSEGILKDRRYLVEYPQHAFYPHYLVASEIKSPLAVIEQLFDFHHLPQFRKALAWWYLIALDDTDASDSRGTKYLFDLHKYLLKLIEAAHLIVHRLKAAAEQNKQTTNR